MSKALADILAAPVSHETQIVPDVCLDQKRRADLQRLRAEQAALLSQVPEVDDDSAQKRKAVQRRIPARVGEIDEEIKRVREEMRDFTGDLVLEATDAAEWQEWKDKHPARQDNKTDEDATWGICDASALIAALPTYIRSWNGEDIAPQQRAAFVKRMAYSDQIATASTVVTMFETRVSVPKSLSGSSPTEDSATD